MHLMNLMNLMPGWLAARVFKFIKASHWLGSWSGWLAARARLEPARARL